MLSFHPSVTVRLLWAIKRAHRGPSGQCRRSRRGPSGEGRRLQQVKDQRLLATVRRAPGRRSRGHRAGAHLRWPTPCQLRRPKTPGPVSPCGEFGFGAHPNSPRQASRFNPEQGTTVTGNRRCAPARPACGNLRFRGAPELPTASVPLTPRTQRPSRVSAAARIARPAGSSGSERTRTLHGERLRQAGANDGHLRRDPGRTDHHHRWRLPSRVA